MDCTRPYRSFVSYMDRSREYYSAQGYEKPYAWAHYSDVPFTALAQPLSVCRVGLVTTAGRIKSEGAFGVGHVREAYAEAAVPPPTRLFTGDLFWDKETTHTDDVDSFLPLKRLAEYAAEGRIGSASPRFYGAPTDYSQRRTTEVAAPQILAWCREDSVDAVLLAGL